MSNLCIRHYIEECADCEAMIRSNFYFNTNGCPVENLPGKSALERLREAIELGNRQLELLRSVLVAEQQRK